MSVEEGEELLLGFCFLLEVGFSETTDVAEDLLHLAAVVATQLLPQVDQYWSELKLDVVAREAGLLYCWRLWLV